MTTCTPELDPCTLQRLVALREDFGTLAMSLQCVLLDLRRLVGSPLCGSADRARVLIEMALVNVQIAEDKLRPDLARAERMAAETELPY